MTIQEFHQFCLFLNRMIHTALQAYQLFRENYLNKSNNYHLPSLLRIFILLIEHSKTIFGVAQGI